MFKIPRPRCLTLPLLGCLAALTVPTAAQADSSVFVVNNTSKPLKLDISSTLSSKYWDKKSTYIQPFSRREIFETNRDKGVKSGKSFYFTTKATFKDPKTGKALKQYPQTFQMRLKLRGSTVGSHMWQSVRDQVGTQHSWHDDRKKYSTGMNMSGTKWNVKYWAYFTGGDDDVEYVFREDYPLPQGFGQKLTQDWHLFHLNVLSYNVYLRPRSLFKNGQMKRAKRIPAQLSGYDVVVFQEAFDDGVRKELLKRMKAKGYKYHSRVLGSDGGVEQDGGVVIVSRWPIVKQKQRLFGSTCSGDDCLADKGVLYVAIKKKVGNKSKIFHVFGTHLNNGNWGIQKSQLEIMRNFINSRKIAKGSPVLMAGDMNINRLDSSKHKCGSKRLTKYQCMLRKLGAGYVGGDQLRGHPYTHDGPLNDLGDGSQSYLDYVLYSKKHLGIMPATFAEVRIPRAYMEWKEFAHEKAMWDLSDHYAVYGNYHFIDDPLSDWDPGIGNSGPSKTHYCNEDSECPTGMKCEIKIQSGGGSGKGGKSVPPSSGSPSNKGAATSRRTTPRSSKGGKSTPPSSSNPANRGATKGNTANAPSSRGRTVNKGAWSKAGGGGIKLYKGVCRIPPPK